MEYILLDTSNGHVLGEYPSLRSALQDVRDEIAAAGTDCVETLALMHVRAGTRSKFVEGKELLDLAHSEPLPASAKAAH